MKKQLLIIMLALFSLGIMGIHQGFAQIILPPTPLDPNCIDLDNPLTPVAGTPYTYQVDVPNPVDGTKTYHWFVTQSTSFIENGGLITTGHETFTGDILASGDTHYMSPTEGANEITLTWESFTLDPTEFVFVVIYVENLDDCTTNNLKVYRILPVHAFTLDLANILPDFSNYSLTDVEQCVADVQEAVFNTTNFEMEYDFGMNTFYYVVAAANFSRGYQLSFNFTGLSGSQVATIYWSKTLADLTGDPIASMGTTSISADVSGEVLGVIETTETVGQAGEMLYIRIDIEHNQFEAANLANDYPYVLELDGVLIDESSNPLDPIDFGDLAQHTTDCSRVPYHNDATQILTARPTVIPIAPDEFVPDNID